MKILLFVLSLLISYPAFAQNYIEYHRLINRIDEDVINEEYNFAIERLDSLYENFSFIYSQHCFKALQISCKSRDSISAKKWLEKSFIQGIPIWMIRTNNLTKDVFTYSTTQNTIDKYDSLRNIYTNSLNYDLRNQIDSLFIIDQKYTQKVNDGFILFRHTFYGLRWVINNRKQFKIIDNIINEYGFPGEKLIGLPKIYDDSVSTMKFISFWGPYLRQWDAYFMLLHYFSTRRNIADDFKDKLYQNLLIGNISPFQYANICSYIYRHSKNPNYESYYGNDVITNRKRLEIGLNSVDQEKRNELINRERRGNKKANSEIILE